MRTILCYYIFLIVLMPKIYSQSSLPNMTDFYTYKNEIGINFTNVLGNVLSLNPNNANSPYGLTYRHHYGKTSFRSALSFDFNKQETNDFNGGGFIQKNLDTKDTQFRLGVEKHIVLHNRILFSYGLDFLGQYTTENSSVEDFNQNTNFTSEEKTFGGGVGPMLRLEYKISERIFISSECSFYGFYSSKKEIIRSSGMNINEANSSSSNLILQLPQSLFFNISF